MAKTTNRSVVMDAIILARAQPVQRLRPGTTERTSACEVTIPRSSSAGDTSQWAVAITRPGAFAVESTFACQPGAEGSESAISAGDRALARRISATRGWADFTTVKVGSLELLQAGKVTITV